MSTNMCGITMGVNYRTLLRRTKQKFKMTLTGLFEAVSIDFAGPFPATANGRKYALISVVQIKGWKIENATQDATSDDTAIKFLKEDVIFQFRPIKAIISDNAACFTAKKLRNLIYANKTSWKSVLEYASKSNGRVERMVGTLKASVKRVVMSSMVS